MKLLTWKRLTLGWSKAELARQCKLHPSQIGLFESGRLEPYPGQLQRLASALGAADGENLLDEVDIEQARDLVAVQNCASD